MWKYVYLEAIQPLPILESSQHAKRAMEHRKTEMPPLPHPWQMPHRNIKDDITCVRRVIIIYVQGKFIGKLTSSTYIQQMLSGGKTCIGRRSFYTTKFNKYSIKICECELWEFSCISCYIYNFFASKYADENICVCFDGERLRSAL